MKKLLTCVVLVGLAAATIIARPSVAQDKDHDHKDHKDDHEAAEVHGGMVVATTHYHFEVVFTETAVRVYVMDAKQKALETDKVTGVVKVAGKAGDHALNNIEADPKKGTARDYLETALDSKALAKGSKVFVQLANLADEHEPKASFEVVFGGVSPKVEYVCPKSCGAKSADPGSCPKCKVDLKKTGDDAHDHKK